MRTGLTGSVAFSCDLNQTAWPHSHTHSHKARRLCFCRVTLACGEVRRVAEAQCVLTWSRWFTLRRIGYSLIFSHHSDFCPPHYKLFFFSVALTLSALAALNRPSRLPDGVEADISTLSGVKSGSWRDVSSLPVFCRGSFKQGILRHPFIQQPLTLTSAVLGSWMWMDFCLWTSVGLQPSGGRSSTGPS